MSKTPEQKKGPADPPPSTPQPPAPASMDGSPDPSSGGEGGANIQRERPLPSRRGSKPGVKRGPYRRPQRSETRERVTEIKGKSLAHTIQTLLDLVSKIPALGPMALDHDEAKALADSLKQWQEAYPDSKLSPKLAANVTLISTLAVVFGPRVVLVWMELQARAELKRQTARRKAPVLHITPRPEPAADPQPGDAEPAE